MSYVLNSPGPTTIYATSVGSTAGVGDWYRVPPRIGKLSFQAILSASSVGATAASSASIEVTNSTAIGLATKGRVFDLTATTDVVSDGGAFQSSMDAAWAWVRGKVTSLSSATAGSTGSPSVQIIVNAAQY